MYFLFLAWTWQTCIYACAQSILVWIVGYKALVKLKYYNQSILCKPIDFLFAIYETVDLLNDIFVIALFRKDKTKLSHRMRWLIFFYFLYRLPNKFITAFANLAVFDILMSWINIWLPIINLSYIHQGNKSNIILLFYLNILQNTLLNIIKLIIWVCGEILSMFIYKTY